MIYVHIYIYIHVYTYMYIHTHTSARPAYHLALLHHLSFTHITSASTFMVFPQRAAYLSALSLRTRFLTPRSSSPCADTLQLTCISLEGQAGYQCMHKYLLVKIQTKQTNQYVYISRFAGAFLCVCMCRCVCVHERERERAYACMERQRVCVYMHKYVYVLWCECVRSCVCMLVCLDTTTRTK